MSNPIGKGSPSNPYSLQEAVQDPNADDDRYVDDSTFDVDTLDAYNYSVENWYKILLKTNLGG